MNLNRIHFLFSAEDILRDIEFQKTNKRELESVQKAMASRTSHYRSSWFEQFRALLWRAFLNVKKNPWIVRINFAQTFVRKI